MEKLTIPEEIAKKYDLEGKLYGKCAKCNCFTSSHQKDKHVEGFLYGCQIDGTWFCDLCLPCHFSFDACGSDT